MTALANLMTGAEPVQYGALGRKAESNGLLIIETIDMYPQYLAEELILFLIRTDLCSTRYLRAQNPRF